MRNKLKISDREIKLLFVFFTLLILFVSYQFGYLQYTNKTDKLNEENQALTKQLAVLKEKNASKDKYKKEIEDLNQKKDAMLEEFAGGFTQEKSTIFVTDLEKYANMNISSITFQDTSAFYTPGMTITGDKNTDETGNTGETEEYTLSKESASDSNIKQDTLNIPITGYETSIVLSYRATYEGLKKCIEYINNYDEKMNISELNAAFDSTTGNLTGTLTVTMYALEGAGRKYIEPQIAGVNLGTDNIFGTFELPLDNTVKESN